MSDKWRTGYVALLDVLGFSTLVARDNEGSELDEYIGCLEQATNGKQGKSGVEYVLFSDSIVLTRTGSDPDSLLSIVKVCAYLFSLLTLKAIPVRGAISCGRFMRNDGKNGAFVAGKPIIEAFEYEKLQNWIGIMLCPSVLRQNGFLKDWCDASNCPRDEATNRLPWVLTLKLNPGVPFHSAVAQSRRFQSVAVIPIPGSPFSWDGYSANLFAVIDSLNRLQWLAPNPGAQEKYDGTIKFIKWAKSIWEERHGFWTTEIKKPFTSDWPI